MKQILLDFEESVKTIDIKEPTEVLGAIVLDSNRKIEINIDINHKFPNSKSLILVKAVLFGESEFDFRGNLIINKGAKLTDTYLKVSVLMMSPNARATAVPALEIQETDVKGGHGATVGQVDHDQLFYLMSHGLSKKQATDLLVEGFLRDVLDRVNSDIDSQYKSEVLDNLAKINS